MSTALVTRLVVDASVVIKLYFAEQYTTEAQRLLSTSYELLAPDLLCSELGNTAWQKVRRGDAILADAQQAVDEFLLAPIELFASSDLLASAFRIASSTGRTVYDSLYLALALAQSCSLVTADERFYNALSATTYSASLTWVGNIP